MRIQTVLITILLTIVCNSLVNAERKISEEAIIFQELQDGVFTVYGDFGQGSGFLIDNSGIIITNHHVVSQSSHIRVLINDSIKVAAKLLYADKKYDIAAILINAENIKGLPVLKVRNNSNDLAFIGEKIIAIGSPLHQTKILTSGVISKVEKEVIISDVNINHGNSGGPLINMDKEVIAINTFGDFTSRGGPGISGSIRIDNFMNKIITLKSKIISSDYPNSELLPIFPKEPFPIWGYENSDISVKEYEKLYSLKVGNFNIHIVTPLYSYIFNNQSKIKLAKKRNKREQKGNVDESDRFDVNANLKSWKQYVGKYKPIVKIYIQPKIGQTSGSAWANFFGAALTGNSNSFGEKYEYKADLKDMILRVNRKERVEIQRFMEFTPLNFFTSNYRGTQRGEDLAKSGLFIFPPNIFSPIKGVWPLVTLEILSLDKTNSTGIVIPQITIEKIWADFEPYRKQIIYNNIPLQATEQ